MAHGANRRGIAGVWLVLSIPLFVAVLGFVLNIGFLWIAEADLESAAASGALAGAKVLGDRPPHDRRKKHGHSKHGHQNSHSNDKAVAAAEEFIKSNGVHGKPISLKGKSKKPAQPRDCRGTILLGSVEGRTFRTSRDAKHADACYVQLACKVEGPLGWLTGPKIIRASATAVVGRDRRPRLVEIDRVKRDD